jgi:outer membrane lipoprotein-sorting protein
MTRRVLTLFISLVVLFCIEASAQTADEIIKKNIDAHGGIQKVKAVKSVKVTGKVLPAGLGQEIPIVIQQKRSNLVRVEATFQGKSQISAYDGQSGWKIDPFQGSSDPERVAGDELKELEEQSDMDGSLVDYKEKGHTVELVGKEDLEGTPVYKLKLTLKNGDVRNIYIDASNYLELKSTSKRQTPGGEIEVENYFGNYKPVNGILMAHSIENKVKGQVVSQVTFDKVEMDIPIDDSVFKMPAKPEEKPKAQEKPKDKPPSAF